MSAGEVEGQGEAPPENETFWARGSILHRTERKPLAVPVVCGVEVRMAGAGKRGRSCWSSDPPAVAWPWSMGTSSPTAQEGDEGLAVTGVQVRDALVSRSGTRCWTWG